MDVFRQLLSNSLRTGRVEWTGTAARLRATITAHFEVQFVADQGIEGEHNARSDNRSKRHVTLIQHEHFPVVAALLERKLAEIAPELLLRNILVSGINLAAIRFQALLKKAENHPAGPRRVLLGFALAFV